MEEGEGERCGIRSLVLVGGEELVYGDGAGREL